MFHGCAARLSKRPLTPGPSLFHAPPSDSLALSKEVGGRAVGPTRRPVRFPNRLTAPRRPTCTVSHLSVAILTLGFAAATAGLVLVRRPERRPRAERQARRQRSRPLDRASCVRFRESESAQLRP